VTPFSASVKTKGSGIAEDQMVSSVGVALLFTCVIVGFALSFLVKQPALAVVGGIAGLYLLFAIRVADQWEKVAVLRLGRFIGLRGPGLFHVIPIVDRLSASVDQRVRVANVVAESTLTRDTVPVNVDANVFWMVWNPEKSILEVPIKVEKNEFDDNFLDIIVLTVKLLERLY